VVLFVCVHVSAFASLLYLASLDILCFVVVSCSWLLFCQLCFFLFVSSFLYPCRCLASLVLSCIATGFGSRMEGFLGDGGGWGGAGSMPEAHCAFHLRLRGGGCAHALAREGKRQQRSRGRHSSTEDGASWLKKEKNADFVAGTAKRLKIAKSCFIFGFWTGFTWVFPGKSGFRHTGSVSTLISEPHFGTGLGPIFAGVSGKSLVSRGEAPPKVWFLVFWFLGRSLANH
jgi:hypothetical protein